MNMQLLTREERIIAEACPDWETFAIVMGLYIWARHPKFWTALVSIYFVAVSYAFIAGW
jgi:hypothetical protein